MAMAAISPFDRLSDEVVLLIITMAKGNDDNDFLLDVLCKVSLRFRRLATDSSLWRDSVKITIRFIPQYTFQKIGWARVPYFKEEMNADFSKVYLMIRECLNGETKELKIDNFSVKGETGPSLVHRNCNLSHFDTLSYLATKCPNLKRVDLIHPMTDMHLTRKEFRRFWKNIIPAPWKRISSPSSFITSLRR